MTLGKLGAASPRMIRISTIICYASMSMPTTLSFFSIGLASCSSVGSLVLNSLWLIEADPHRGGSISLRPDVGVWEVVDSVEKVRYKFLASFPLRL